MGKLKIFCIYYGQSQVPLYRSDCIEPIQAGCALFGERPGALRDDTGDNISVRNREWAELTAHYWVLRNWLLQNKDVEYVGFCHYRRFLDFNSGPLTRFRLLRRFIPFGAKYVSFKKFSTYFGSKYIEKKIYPVVNGYDIITTGKVYFPTMDIYGQYIYSGHPDAELQRLKAIIREGWPDYVDDMERFFSGNEAYMWMNFIMKRSWLQEYLEWQFAILNKLEATSDWEHLNMEVWASARPAAFLAERFINVWIWHKLRTENTKILERQLIKLVDDNDKPSYASRLYGLLKRLLNGGFKQSE